MCIEVRPVKESNDSKRTDVLHYMFFCTSVERKKHQCLSLFTRGFSVVWVPVEERTYCTNLCLNQYTIVQ